MDHSICTAYLDAVAIVEIVGQPNGVKPLGTGIADSSNDAGEGVAGNESSGMLWSLKFCAGNLEASLCATDSSACVVRPQVAQYKT